MNPGLVSKVEMTARQARHELAELMPLLKQANAPPELGQSIASAVYEIGSIASAVYEIGLILDQIQGFLPDKPD